MAGCAVSLPARLRGQRLSTLSTHKSSRRRCRPPIPAASPPPHRTSAAACLVPRAAGCNSNGQLGVGDTADVAEPQSLKVARRWAARSMGSSHAAGVTGQGEVYTWGLNDKGQLGSTTGPGENKDAPKRMELLVGWNVK